MLRKLNLYGEKSEKKLGSLFEIKIEFYFSLRRVLSLMLMMLMAVAVVVLLPLSDKIRFETISASKHRVSVNEV